MASNSRSSGTAAFRYASALVDVALRSDSIAKIEQDIIDLEAMLAASAGFQSLIRSPIVKASSQMAFLGVLANTAKLSPLTKNFLFTLTQNRRLKDAAAIFRAVRETLAMRRGEVSAKVQTAAPLNAAQKKALEDNLSKKIGHPVTVEASINTDLIGGMIVTLGSLMIDESIKSKLDRLSRAMKYHGKAA